jgi:hypothetical protein
VCGADLSEIDVISFKPYLITLRDPRRLQDWNFPFQGTLKEESNEVENVVRWAYALYISHHRDLWR